MNRTALEFAALEEYLLFLHSGLSILKRLGSISLLVLGGFCLSANTAQAWTIYPLRIARDLQPGKSFTEVVTIDNTGSSETTRIEIEPIDWVLTDKGENDFPAAGTAKNSITKSISFHPAQLTLGPGERRSMRVTVALPEDIGPGEHIGGLSAREKVIPRPAPPQSQRVTVSIAVQRIYVMPIIVTVKGGKEVAGSIEELRLEKSGTDLPYKAVVKVRNTGIVRITPAITFILKDQSGKEVFTSTKANYLVTREFAREVSMVLPKDLVGKFTLQVNLDQGKAFSLLTAQKEVELLPQVEKAAPAVPVTRPSSATPSTPTSSSSPSPAPRAPVKKTPVTAKVTKPQAKVESKAQPKTSSNKKILPAPQSKKPLPSGSPAKKI